MKYLTTVLILESLATMVILPASAIPAPAAAAAAPSYQCIVTQSRCPALCAGGGPAESCKGSYVCLFPRLLSSIINCKKNF